MFEFVMQVVCISLGIFWYNDIDTLMTLSSLLPAIMKTGT